MFVIMKIEEILFICSLIDYFLTDARQWRAFLVAERMINMISELINNDIKQHPELKTNYEKQKHILDLAVETFILRQTLGCSQETFAQLLGVKSDIIKQIESGDIL